MAVTKYQKKLAVRKGDTVVVNSGDDKGKKGKVLEVSPGEGQIIVEGINIVTKHVNPDVRAKRAVLLRQKARSMPARQMYTAQCATRA